MNLEYWKLHKEFSLHEAACLMDGIDPRGLQDGSGISYYEPDGALVSALQKAAMSGELKGFVRVGDSAEWWVTECIEIAPFKETDWCKVVFHKNDIVKWLESTELRPAFFFPDESNDKAASIDQAYMTPKMQLVSDAVAELWQGVDPLDKHAPTNENVEDWLNDEAKKRGIQWSKRLSESVATIIRHPDKP